MCVCERQRERESEREKRVKEKCTERTYVPLLRVL